jgi:hypothetical protein
MRGGLLKIFFCQELKVERVYVRQKNLFTPGRGLLKRRECKDEVFVFVDSDLGEDRPAEKRIGIDAIVKDGYEKGVFCIKREVSLFGELRPRDEGGEDIGEAGVKIFSLRNDLARLFDFMIDFHGVCKKAKEDGKQRGNQGQGDEEFKEDEAALRRPFHDYDFLSEGVF